MSRPSTWRDLSATSKAGLTAVEFRLRLPKGEVILKKLPSVPFDPSLKASNLWSVRCFALGLHDTPLTADSETKAKKQALAIIKDRLDEMADLAATCSPVIARAQTAKD